MTCLSQCTKERATDELRFGCDGWNLIGTLNSQLSTPFQPSTSFVSYDGNGNVVALVSAADGAETARYEYGPFGEVIRMTGPACGTNPFRFSTKYQDDETDLLYYGYRYYTPNTGRWISPDPSQEKGGLNLYAAAQNDLEDRIDALGEYALPIQVHPDYDPSYFTKKEVGLFAAYGTLDPGKPVPCACGYRTKGWSINFIGHIWIKRGHSPNGDKDLVGQTILQHEMGHAKSYENYLTAMEGVLKTMSSGCFTPLCYYGWQKYYMEMDTYRQAQMNLDAASWIVRHIRGIVTKSLAIRLNATRLART